MFTTFSSNGSDTHTHCITIPMLVFLTRTYTNETLLCHSPVTKIMWAGSCDLIEYSSTNFTIWVPKSLINIQVFALFVSALFQNTKLHYTITHGRFWPYGSQTTRLCLDLRLHKNICLCWNTNYCCTTVVWEVNFSTWTTCTKAYKTVLLSILH